MPRKCQKIEEVDSGQCATNQLKQQEKNNESINEQLTKTNVREKTGNKTITLINKTKDKNIPEVTVNNKDNKIKTSIACKTIKNSDAS